MPKRAGAGKKQKKQSSALTLPELLAVTRAARRRVVQLATRLEAAERALVAAVASAAPAASRTPGAPTARKPAVSRPPAPKPAVRKAAARKPAIRKPAHRG